MKTTTPALDRCKKNGHVVCIVELVDDYDDDNHQRRKTNTHALVVSEWLGGHF